MTAGVLLVVAATLALAFLQLGVETAGARPDVFVTGGGRPAFTGPEDAALDEAAARAGVNVKSISDKRYTLSGIVLEDPVEEAPIPGVSVQLLYSGSGEAMDRLSIDILSGYQPPASGGRQIEPPPEPIGRIGTAEVVRIELGESEGYTAWTAEFTYHFVFTPAIEEDRAKKLIADYLN